MTLRCSICDKTPSRWIYRNWHCNECEEVITNTIGSKPKDKDEPEHVVEQEFDDE